MVTFPSNMDDICSNSLKECIVFHVTYMIKGHNHKTAYRQISTTPKIIKYNSLKAS